MKTRVTLWLLFALAVGESARSSELLTNNIPLGQTGMRLVISDENPDQRDRMLEDTELSTERHLWWMLHTTSTNPWQSVIFIGLSNAFDSRLMTTNGLVVPKTDRGKSMSAGPKKRTDLYAGKFVRRIGAGIQDFPKLDDLFAFPSNGVYFLEVRYWLWDTSKKEFCTSPPVRVRVIKQRSGSGPVQSIDTKVPIGNPAPP